MLHRKNYLSWLHYLWFDLITLSMIWNYLLFPLFHCLSSAICIYWVWQKVSWLKRFTILVCNKSFPHNLYKHWFSDDGTVELVNTCDRVSTFGYQTTLIKTSRLQNFSTSTGCPKKCVIGKAGLAKHAVFEIVNYACSVNVSYYLTRICMV